MLSEYQWDLDELLNEDKFADMREYFRDEIVHVNQEVMPQLEPDILVKQPEPKKEEKEEVEDLTLCCICMDDKKDVLFLPCKHICACANCSNVKTCPICRTDIISKIDGVFF